MSSRPEAGARLLGGRLANSERLAGGSLDGAFAVTLEDGREAVVKGGPSPRIEAAMLEAIAASGAPAPAVFAVDDTTLVIERLPSGHGAQDDWRGIGEALAILHADCGSNQQTPYGWHENYAFGRLLIDNERADDWPQFWAERRLLTHLPQLPAPLATRIERLAQDLPNRLPERPAPSLLHGDLWGGNVLVGADGLSGFIDPACYRGHGEVDIAMLGVFDSPAPAFFAAYGQLDSGHEERLAIYALWPALVHFRLFGRGYLGMVERYLSHARS